MSNTYNTLIDFVTSTGIPRGEAEIAVRRCALAMFKNGVAFYTGSAVIAYFMNTNPGSAASYLAGSMALGAGYGLAKAPQCQEVRGALKYWTNFKL